MIMPISSGSPPNTVHRRLFPVFHTVLALDATCRLSVFQGSGDAARYFCWRAWYIFILFCLYFCQYTRASADPPGRGGTRFINHLSIVQVLIPFFFHETSLPAGIGGSA